jgi:hypothetical protein
MIVQKQLLKFICLYSQTQRAKNLIYVPIMGAGGRPGPGGGAIQIRQNQGAGHFTTVFPFNISSPKPAGLDPPNFRKAYPKLAVEPR